MTIDRQPDTIGHYYNEAAPRIYLQKQADAAARKHVRIYNCTRFLGRLFVQIAVIVLVLFFVWASALLF